MDSETNQTLVQRSQAGDRAAFALLVERNRRDLRAALVSSVDPRLRDVLGIDELTQETIVSAFASIKSFTWSGEGSFAAWLQKIGRNVVRNAIRRAKRHSTLQITREPSRSDPTPSRTLRREERFVRLEDAFNALHPDYREVIRLSRIEGLSFVEIGRRMARSPDAVRKLLGRALAELRRTFGNTESLHLPNRRMGDREDA